MAHDQLIASDPALSVWVSASAGTGKTKVLTDRVLRLLLSGAAPARILCITYTKAAAAEMESRISAELARWVAIDDEALAQSLLALTGTAPAEKLMAVARRLFAEVLDAPQRIRIQTIHSFCQSVLMRFPLEAGVPPHFTPIDDITSRELLEDARRRLFTDAGLSHNHAVALAISALAEPVAESTLNELIADIIRQRRAFSDYLAAAPDASRTFSALGLVPGLDEETLAARHLAYTEKEESDLRHCCEALSQSGKPLDLASLAALSPWLENRTDRDAYADFFFTQEGSPRKKLHTVEAAKRWPGITEVLASEQRRIIAYAEERRTLRVAQTSHHITVLAGAILGIYARLKERHGYLDYDDLILFTVQLLHREGVAPWVLYKLDGGIDHMLIDEAQDTAFDQWRIALALAGEFFAGVGARSLKRTLFVVGDEKQSIFSFQGADPLIFDDTQRGIARLAAGAGEDFRRVRLSLSFRSTAPVLAAVDSVFALPAARDGLVFTESEIHHEVHRKGAAGRVELWPLNEAPDEDTLPPWHIPDTSAYTQRPHVQCAEQIAETIAGWLKEKRLLASQNRPVAPGDVMILVQRRSAFADAMLRALKRRNIAVAGADRLVLTEHIAVQDLMALANFLLLPQDDLTLAALLKSPFTGLPEEAVFELAHNRGEQTLWQRLKEYPRYLEAYDFLSAMLSVTDYKPPYELFMHALETLGGRKKLAARLGEEINDPLNEFLALTLHYGKMHAPSLQGFLHWLETGATEIKRDMEKDRDEVRILTVHGAKGLQAPIVFLPDTVRVPPHDSGILWLPSAFSLPLWAPGSAFYDRHYRTLRERRREEAMREYRRLLYVAMTRAEDELYICGYKGGKAVDGSCWHELVKMAAQQWEKQDDKYVLASRQEAQVKPRSDPPIASLPLGLPGWAVTEAASEPTPARPLSPSAARHTGDILPPHAALLRERGILAHRLLQYLPDVAAAKRDEVMARFLERYGSLLSPEERRHVGGEVMAIITRPEFAPVFGPNSVAEASISGMAGSGGQIVAGRIDRIAVLERDVYIVDYKTGRKVPANESQVPQAYLRQVDTYRQLVKMIYPDKTVHCALIWTTGPKLITLSESLLESLAA